MKLKKVLAGFMAAVVSAATLISGSVTASASSSSSTYVDGFWNGEGSYAVRIGNGGIFDIITLGSQNPDAYNFEYVNIWLDIADYPQVCLHCTFDVNEEALVVTPYIQNGSSYTYYENEIYTSRIFVNDESDNGIVMFMKDGSSLLNVLASCNSVTISGQGVWTTQENKYYPIDMSAFKVTPSFSGLEDYIIESAQPENADIANLKFGKLSSKSYTGKAIKPSVTVKDGDKKLVKGTDYTVSYKNNTKIGTATVIVTGKGKYSGTKELTFNIVPKKTKISIDEVSKSKAVINWKQSKGADGYEIWCSTNGESYTKLSTIKSAKTLTKTITKLNTQKNVYKFRVRPYAKVNGKTVYGSWSNIVSAG